MPAAPAIVSLGPSALQSPAGSAETIQETNMADASATRHARLRRLRVRQNMFYHVLSTSGG
jgi:hypothetical protein